MYISKCYFIIAKYWGTNYQLLVYRVIKLLLNITYPIYLMIHKKRKINEHSNIVVSMTSFPMRIKKVSYVIESLLRQTNPPKKIILWLASTQFKNIQIPKRLRKLEHCGLEIHFCEDLRSHKKYYYAMKIYTKENIVTVDDDTYYPENLLEILYNAHKKHPDSVIAMLVHKLKYSDDGLLLGYEEWEKAVNNVLVPSFDLVAIGCEGVLYPPNILNKDVFDKTYFMKSCRNADDLWLKAMSLLNKKKVFAAVDKPITFVNVLNTQRYSLHKENNNYGNNEQLENIKKRYPELFSKRI